MFVQGTLVHTGSGLKPIEALRPGTDLLLTFPRDKLLPQQQRQPSEFVFKRLLRMVEIEDQSVLGLEFANLASGDRELLLTSPRTGIYRLIPEKPGSPRESQQWALAGDINPGDGLATHLFGHLLVVGTYPPGATRTKLYALEVKDTNSLYVGSCGVWVGDGNEAIPAA